MITIEINEMSELIDGIEYKLFANDRGPAVRILDMGSSKPFIEINYPNVEMAQDAYRTATAAAWQLAASSLTPARR